MADDGPPPRLPSLADEWREAWRTGPSGARDRVYATALQLSEPTRPRAVAERADVTTETAREYLEWFVDLGLLERADGTPDAFRRNEAYFEWRRIERLRSLTEAERRDRFERLARQERRYRQRFEADGPEDVDPLDHDDDPDAVRMGLSEWRTVRRRLRELDRARRAPNP